jgi:hypothetical protein
MYGQKLFVITNQARVALGYLNRLGGVVTDYRICMHHPPKPAAVAGNLGLA